MTSTATMVRTAAVILLASPSGLRSSSRSVDARPEIRRPELLAAAGLEIYEQLRSIRGMPAQHQIDDKGPLGDRAAIEAGHLGAEIGVRHVAEHLRVKVALRRNRGDGLIEVAL